MRFLAWQAAGARVMIGMKTCVDTPDDEVPCPVPGIGRLLPFVCGKGRRYGYAALLYPPGKG